MLQKEKLVLYNTQMAARKAISTGKSKRSTGTSVSAKVKSRARKTEEIYEDLSDSSMQPERKPLIRLRKSYFFTLFLLSVIVIVVVGFLSWNRGYFILATVNGAPVDRLSFIKETEKLAGLRALQALILKSLVEQEASNKNVTVSQQEIDEKFKEIEKQYKDQGQDLAAVLSSQGLKKSDIVDYVRQDLLMGKLVKGDVKVTDKDVDGYIAQNKDSLPKDKKEEELNKEVRDMLTKNKLDEKKQALLAKLQKDAKIKNYTTYILPF